MKKNSKSKKASVDPYFEGVVAKLVDRLVSLEKKMDVVIHQTAEKQSGGDPSRPIQSIGKPPARKDRTLYEAICADCHKICEVPFKPSEVRPVYCKECFAKRRAGGSGNVYPVLTAVSLPPKPVSKLGNAPTPIPQAKDAPKKAKKTKPAKKVKRKK